MHDQIWSHSAANPSRFSNKYRNDFNTSKYSSLINKKYFEKIIKVEKLFLIAYGNALYSNQNIKNKAHFWVSPEDKNIFLSFSGKNNIVKATFKFIERMRKFLLEGLQNKENVEILLIKKHSNVYLECSKPIIKINSKKYYNNYYKKFIEPSLVDLADILGAIFFQTKRMQKIESSLQIHTKEVEVLQFIWKRTHHFIYLIPPISFETNNNNFNMYSLFLDQKFCDFDLKSKDESIKIHSSIVYLHGGPIFSQKCTIEKSFKIKDHYSIKVIKTFIKFIYFPGDEFIKHMTTCKDDFELIELYQFSKFYKIKLLRDCCINLMGLFEKSIALKKLNKPEVLMNHLDSEYETFELYDCLKRNDFKKIISNKNLFWLAYCKAYSKYSMKKKGRFYVSVDENSIKFYGSIIKSLQKIIEKIRVFFLKGMETKSNFEILVLSVGNYCFLKQPSESNNEENLGHSSCNFSKYIQYVLKEFAEIFGLYFNQFIKENCIIQNTNKILIKNVYKLYFSWPSEKPIIYPFTPKFIPPVDLIQISLFKLYQQKVFCDFKIKTKKHLFKVHASILYINGGAIIQKILTINMNEKKRNQILFENYSRSTIHSFIHFIYLGENAFSEYYFSYLKQSKRTIIDLYKLLSFAHCFQIDSLINCCTNLISLIVTKKNIKTIKYFANLYSNEHLKILHKNLLDEETPNYSNIIMN
ncbi:MAG: BTB/POZ domain-containing protein [Parachlamydiaceae bacterium]|nr:BTB/POZ domain-containing protein [Parachlamydiaceae bacterium]